MNIVAFETFNSAARGFRGRTYESETVRGLRPSNLVGGLIFCGLAALATWAYAMDRGALWHVVRACVADKNLTGSPLPCLDVDLTGGEERGYIVLREPLSGDTILAPTRRITGVEDPLLYSGDVPNYFDAAWRARSFLEGPDGKKIDRDRIALAVNSGVVRSQDQLHIHIGCLLPAAETAVRAIAPQLGLGEWTQVGAIVPHSMFWAMRIRGTDLATVQPFALAADYFDGRVRNRGDIMLAVVPVQAAGDDDFLILATYTHAPHAWWPVGAEDLLDTSCSTAPALPG